MALTLQKGGNVSLTKAAPGLSNAVVGLGWDARSTDGAAFDLDASAILVDASGKVREEKDFVFYGNKESGNGAVKHLGDNLTGAGDGDDETITVDLTTVPADVDKIVIAASIYEADVRNQNFGQVRNAYIRVLNADGNEEIVKYDLAEDSSTETAVIFGELYRNGSDWKFRAVGQGYTSGLLGIATDFGVQIG